MTEKLSRLTASEIIKIPGKRGFTLSRQRGSHKIFKDENGNRATVPFHSAKILHPKVLKSIMREADLTVEDLNKLLK